jgi:hypothetical protein
MNPAAIRQRLKFLKAMAENRPLEEQRLLSYALHSLGSWSFGRLGP